MKHVHFFNFDDLEGGIERNLAPGLDTNIYCGDQAMISVVRFEPNSKGAVHSHPEEQWGICVSGEGIRIQGDERIAVSVGDFWVTPGGTPHGMEAGKEGMKVIDVFAPPRGDYKKAGSGFSA